jgi:hypothetical protein
LRPIIPIREVALAYVKSVAAAKPELASKVSELERNDWSDAQVTIRRYAERVRNPMTAIRAKCIECSGGSIVEVKECRVFGCALHPFREGINPHNKKTKERLARKHGAAEGDDDDDGGEE